MNKYDVMFHLAAVHGGRGYVDRQQALISSNFALDSHCFMEARDVGVKKIVYASSGCVYPNFLQEHASQELYLKESLVPPVGQGSDVKTLMRMFEGQFTFMGYDADGIYGYAKLMAEFTLQAYHKAYGIETASCRYFTAYGPRAKEDHAVMAMIARAFSQQKPFEIWGDGTQIRNWTYIDDIVFGTLLVAEEVTDGRGVNVGTMERTSVKQAADFICRYMDVAMSAEYAPEFKFLLDMPTGPMNRVASNELIKSLGYGDFAPFHEGIIKTIAWYMKTKTPEEAAWLLKDGKLIDGLKR
jgi:nucleoside-diphosphate-sugar epimerase